MSLPEIMEWINATAFSTGLRESAYAYPLIEGTHVLSLALSVGMIIWFDLRLVGWAMRGESITGLYASLRPWLFTGFCLMIVTGIVLFVSRAADVWVSGYFRVKLVLLVLCLINVLVYHLTIGRSTAGWDTAGIPPTSARIVGLISLVLWFSVIAVGRIMAYTL